MGLLLIDTCGEAGSVAVADDRNILAAEELPARAASSTLLPAVERVLKPAGLAVRNLDGVAVVSGPGSFTGVRVGMAAAKGLCEASALPLATVSRLAVLGEVAHLESGFAVLDAGRGELFVRRYPEDERHPETLRTCEQLLAEARGRRVAIAETRLLAPLAALTPELHVLSASSALPLALAAFAAGCDDVALADANYVRSELQIYGRTVYAPAQTATV